MNVNKQRYSVVVLIAAGLALVIISGCMVGPEYHPPQPTVVPPAWEGVSKIPTDQPSVATAQPADLTQWWRQFNDPILNELVEEAVKANLDLQIAGASLRQARALRGIAIGGLWPSVAASGSYQRLHSAATMSGQSAARSLSGRFGCCVGTRPVRRHTPQRRIGRSQRSGRNREHTRRPGQPYCRSGA